MRWILLLVLMGCMPRVTEFRYSGSSAAAPFPLVEYSIYLDKNFGELDKIEIEKGICQWNYALNGYVKMEIVDSNFDMEVEVLRGMGEGDWLILKVGSDGVSDGTLGYVDHVGGNIVHIVRDRVENDWVSGIVMHEIGHLLGVRHDQVYLMQEKYKWAEFRCIDYGTMELVSKEIGIGIEQLNYCQYY